MRVRDYITIDLGDGYFVNYPANWHPFNITDQDRLMLRRAMEANHRAASLQYSKVSWAKVTPKIITLYKKEGLSK